MASLLSGDTGASLTWASRMCCQARAGPPDSWDSLFKNLKRKAKTKTCDLEETRDSPLVFSRSEVSTGGWHHQGRLMLWFYSLSPILSFGSV